MRRLTGALAAGALGVAGIVGLGIVPASADTSTGTTTTDTAVDGLAERVQRIRDALAGLITDGTITEGQADAVAQALGESEALRGPHGHGPMGGASLTAAAETLGLTEEELRDALADGSSLADVAETNGVTTAELVDALVAAAQEEIDAAVADGRLDQDRADEMTADLEERITAMVDGDLPGPMGGHHGPRGDWAEDDPTGDGADEGQSGEDQSDDSADGATAETTSTVWTA
ncbi:hypothetical protein [Georgenia sp. SUBG003]|uniref:hypothetical protein n=1 Tax=Georgenia sp. SUBG003 TaxID=1497974 RepID=UPI0004DB1894|nr:hypothetical protein DA06_10785 [Georgenia sp. SUBG003]